MEEVQETFNPSPRMGKHICVKCLEPTKTLKEFLRNDHICNKCAKQEETFPLASPSHFETYRPIDHYAIIQ